ncbi:chromosome segregation protein SMC [Aggregicoccus sp. 17bor-14]|uniref:chromosome segregation protein SMC n=1 Tax=Myxococcaceae TaxID=31 RepID=UPI00129D03F9|nr:MULTISPECIES: chromosome segregation protein SMC [Myxococcaceae]MBF5043943.1 chromosome segregation protein SMC [Simulacricoccus sp. 17bor-14]MRI89694.1 chromosome segregation protein SMC [Aggregicoccus sp. 17bor-14]
MHLLELAVQNVRGFTPAGRHPLKLGYVVLRGPSAETAPIAQLAMALLYPDGRGGDAALVAPGQRTGKAALSLQGNDGVTYRVLRELGGAGGLHRLNPETQKPELVSQDAAEMVQVLRAQAGAPTRGVFEQVYCLRPGQLPSRKPRAAPEPPPRASASGLPAVAPGGLGTPVTPARDVPAAQARAGVLEQELTLAREVEAMQFEADGMTSQLFELDRRFEAHEALRARAEAARAEAQATPGPEALGLPQDIVARATRYPSAKSRRDEALAKVRAERDELDPSAVGSKVPPLWKDQAFWGWTAAGAAALLLGFLLQGPGKYVALLDVPLFGVAAVLALRYVEELQYHARETGRGGRSAAREKKILEDFEAEVSAVLNAVRALDVDEPKDVVPALARREEVRQRALQLEAEFMREERSQELAQARARKEELRVQLAELNARIEQQGAYTRDAREVERELARTRESIALALQPAAGAAGPGAPGSDALEDPTPALLALAADLLGVDARAAAQLLRDRCLQYFTALTDRRYPQVEWDAAGRAQVLVAAGGRKVGAGELPPRDLDLYAIALRLTVVERASARVKVPFLVEDVFQGLLDEVKLPLVARMLKHLGTLTQVVHATAHPGFAQMADASASV